MGAVRYGAPLLYRLHGSEFGRRNMATNQAPSQFEGIPIFLRSGDLETELENRQMMTAVELGKKLGWRGALESIYAPDEIAYMSDANRCKFLDLLPLSKDNTIALEIGCGLGQHTAAIARRVKHLDVLEVRLLSALFTKHSLRTKFSRKRQFCLWRRRLPDTLSERYLRYRYP